MSIATYADLQTQVATYLNRSNLTAQIPDFVQLAEARIAYGSKEQPFASDPLRIRAMEVSATAPISAQQIPLPPDFLQQRRLYISGGQSNSEVKYRTPDQFWERWNTIATGMPTEFTVEGENLVFGPSPDTAYTGNLLYHAKFTALSTPVDTNWLLANAPGAYLHGTLLEAYRFTRATDQALQSLNTFCGVINALNEASGRDRYSAPWAAKSDTSTP